MKRVLAAVIVGFVAVGALSVVGCGQKQAPSVNSGTAESPEEVVKAFCQAVIDDRYEKAEGYWDEAGRERLGISTNNLTEVVKLETTGSGNKRHVAAEVYYLQCESGERLKGTDDFDLVFKDGKWKITSAEGPNFSMMQGVD